MHTDSSGHTHEHDHDHPHTHDHPHEHSHDRALEQALNEMAQQSRALEAYMNDIVARQAAIGRMFDEARLASTTLQGISADAEVETLMPVGSGIYVKANVPPMKKVIVSLGSGVTVEKSKEDALNFVEARIKEYDVAIRQLEAQRQEIAMRMEQLQQQLNAMLRQAQSG
ncbi:prefoldin subunit alpha [Nitrososphaera sp.]|uniref:prefoldin subunit alpha n=1 Tax=Nitrososphaera sp. TaxID=1971748 RepID=UPI0017ADDD58|nr:prefoldin subunit alpha [Nitrososphaera sp.]NWG36174.1 prefoldin subunit alpha [Nitrososphaera sp.]